MGYGDGQVNRAAIRAYSEQERYQQDQALREKQDARAEAENERAMRRETREITLFEQQQALFKDQKAQAEYDRKFNQALAVWNATNGQVWQPFADLYNEALPDGGRFNRIVRKDDGTFDVTFSFGGETINRNVSKDDLGKAFFAMGDPQGFLKAQNESAAEERAHRYALELQAAKDKLDVTDYINIRGKLQEQYAAQFGSLSEGTLVDNAPDFDTWARNQLVQWGMDPKDAAGVLGTPRSSLAADMNELASVYSSKERFRAAQREMYGDNYDTTIADKLFTKGNEEELAEHIYETARRTGKPINKDQARAIASQAVVTPAGKGAALTPSQADRAREAGLPVPGEEPTTPQEQADAATQANAEANAAEGGALDILGAKRRGSGGRNKAIPEGAAEETARRIAEANREQAERRSRQRAQRKSADKKEQAIAGPQRSELTPEELAELRARLTNQSGV